MLMLLPVHGMVTDQSLIGEELVLVTVRSTLRPVPQSEVTFTPTVSAAFELGALVVEELVVEELGVAVGVGAAVGVVVAVGLGVGVGVAVGVGVDEPPSAPTTVHVPAGITHVLGDRVPPRGAPRKPKVTDAPLASEEFQLRPANR